MVENHARRNYVNLIRQGAVPIALVLLAVVLTITTERFLTAGNILNILEQISMIGIIGMGMVLLLITANFDLSVGGIVVLSGVIGARLINSHNVAVGIIAIIVISAILGLINGMLVVTFRVNSLIATLGSGLVFTGLAYLISGAQPVVLIDRTMHSIMTFEILGVALPIVILAVCVLVTAWFLHTTTGGRCLYAMGANRVAARFAGIPVKLLQYIAFTITGIFCGIASTILLGLLSSMPPGAASNWPLQVIAGVVVGGVAITGGRGSVLAGILGILLVGVVSNGLSMLNVDPSYQNIVTGLFIIGAVALDATLQASSKQSNARHIAESHETTSRETAGAGSHSGSP